MHFIIIDNFNGSINILTNEEGEVVQFNSAKEAQEYSNTEAQNGIVVPLTTILQLLKNTSEDIEGVNEIINS